MKECKATNYYPLYQHLIFIEKYIGPETKNTFLVHSPNAPVTECIIITQFKDEEGQNILLHNVLLVFVAFDFLKLNKSSKSELFSSFLS